MGLHVHALWGCKHTWLGEADTHGSAHPGTQPPLGPHESSTVLRARECLGAEERKPPAPWQSRGPRTLSSKAWTLSGQAASPSQLWSVGGGTWGVSPGQQGKAGCPAAPWLLPFSPYTPFLSSLPLLLTNHSSSPARCLLVQTVSNPHCTEGETEAWREQSYPGHTAR